MTTNRFDISALPTKGVSKALLNHIPKIYWMLEHVHFYSHIKKDANGIHRLGFVVDVNEEVLLSFNQIFGTSVDFSLSVWSDTDNRTPQLLAFYVSQYSHWLIACLSLGLPTATDMSQLISLLASLTTLFVQGFDGEQWIQMGKGERFNPQYTKYRFFMHMFCLEYDVPTMRLRVYVLNQFSDIKLTDSIASLNEKYSERHLRLDNYLLIPDEQQEMATEAIQTLNHRSSQINLHGFKYHFYTNEEIIQSSFVDGKALANDISVFFIGNDMLSIFKVRDALPTELVRALFMFCHEVVSFSKELHQKQMQNLSVGHYNLESTFENSALYNPNYKVKKNLSIINKILIQAITHTTGVQFSRLFDWYTGRNILGREINCGLFYLLQQGAITTKSVQALDNYYQHNRSLIYLYQPRHPEMDIYSKFTPDVVAKLENLKPDMYGIIKPEHVELFRNTNSRIFAQFLVAMRDYFFPIKSERLPSTQKSDNGALMNFYYELFVWLVKNKKINRSHIYSGLNCNIHLVNNVWKTFDNQAQVNPYAQRFYNGKQINVEKVFAACFVKPIPRKSPNTNNNEYRDMVHNWVSTGVQMAIQYLKYCTPIDHKSPPIWGVGALGEVVVAIESEEDFTYFLFNC